MFHRYCEIDDVHAYDLMQLIEKKFFLDEKNKSTYIGVLSNLEII